MLLVEKYVFKLLVKNFFLVSLALLILLSFFKLIDEISSTEIYTFSFLSALYYVLLLTPSTYSSIASLGLLIAAVITAGSFASNRELQILQAGSVSVKKTFFFFLKFSSILMLISFVLVEIFNPILSQSAERFKAEVTGESSSISFGNIWIKDKDNYIKISKNPGDVSFYDLTLINSKFNKINSISFSDKARLTNNSFLIDEIKSIEFSKSKEITKINTFEDFNTSLNIDPELLSLFSKKPENMNFIELIKQISFLKTGNMNFQNVEVELYRRLLKIPNLIAMIFIGLPFMFSYSRMINTPRASFVGISIALFSQLLTKLFSVIALKFTASTFFLLMVPTLILLVVGKFFFNRLDIL